MTKANIKGDESLKEAFRQVIESAYQDMQGVMHGRKNYRLRHDELAERLLVIFKSQSATLQRQAELEGGIKEIERMARLYRPIPEPIPQSPMVLTSEAKAYNNVAEDIIKYEARRVGYLKSRIATLRQPKDKSPKSGRGTQYGAGI